MLQPYKRRSQAAKEAREKELAAWQRTLTPDDIKRENQFRAAQRRAGKSRKGNIKDPNAPKKPLSAYFMFLQHIRADPNRVKQVFGDEKETTAQSVLAAQFWRSMSDEEKRVSPIFLIFIVFSSIFAFVFPFRAASRCVPHHVWFIVCLLQCWIRAWAS